MKSKAALHLALLLIMQMYFHQETILVSLLTRWEWHNLVKLPFESFPLQILSRACHQYQVNTVTLHNKKKFHLTFSNCNANIVICSKQNSLGLILCMMPLFYVILSSKSCPLEFLFEQVQWKFFLLVDTV